MSKAVSSTTFPCSKSDENFLRLISEGSHALHHIGNNVISTTSWTYSCIYCKFLHSSRKIMMSHMTKSHKNIVPAYGVDIE